MDYALLVSGLERLSNLLRDRQGILDWQGPSAIRSARMTSSTNSMTMACPEPVDGSLFSRP
jgi:hypothetical protein